MGVLKAFRRKSTLSSVDMGQKTGLDNEVVLHWGEKEE
jgi:hypothetical protein